MARVRSRSTEPRRAARFPEAPQCRRHDRPRPRPDAGRAARAASTPRSRCPRRSSPRSTSSSCTTPARRSEGVRMQAGPNAMTELPSMLHGLAKSEIEVVEPLPIEFSQATPVDRPAVRGDAVAERPPRPLAGHPPCARRPRVDRRDRPRVRHVRLHAPRRRGRHERLPRVLGGRRRRRVPLGRGDRRHDRPGGRRLGRQGRPRRHGPDRAPSSSPAS